MICIHEVLGMEVNMARVVSIGAQDFEKLISQNNFMWIKQILLKNGGKVMTLSCS